MGIGEFAGVLAGVVAALGRGVISGGGVPPPGSVGAGAGLCAFAQITARNNGARALKIMAAGRLTCERLRGNVAAKLRAVEMNPHNRLVSLFARSADIRVERRDT
jgi:hypothetical protein